MPTKTLPQKPKIVLDDGRPESVIIDFRTYQQLLEKAEEMEDLKELRRLKQRKLNFRPFGEFLNEHSM